MEIDWRKFILVTGKPGTGKTQTLLRCIDYCMSMHRSVHVATPTGFLATRYQQEFHDDITADTVHSAFHYPVSPDEPASTNWEIAHFDLVVLDEISMV